MRVCIIGMCAHHLGVAPPHLTGGVQHHSLVSVNELTRRARPREQRDEAGHRTYYMDRGNSTWTGSGDITNIW